MSAPTYHELATNFDLWTEHVCDRTTRAEFDAMGLQEKLDFVDAALYYDAMDCAE